MARKTIPPRYLGGYCSRTHSDCRLTAATLSALLARSGRCDYNTDRSMDAGFKPKAEILPTHTRALFDAAVARAAQLLSAGELVALPTETVYGLAANALDARAVAKVFEVKGRPAHNPVIVHVASTEMARRLVADWPSWPSSSPKPGGRGR